MGASGDNATPAASWAYRFIAALAMSFVRLMRWRVTVVGLDNVPRRGGAVLAWNHISHVDFILAAWGLRRLRRLPRFLAKRELWSSRGSRRVVNAVGAVPVDRASGEGRARSFETAVETLRAGEIVAVAPEGTISLSFEPLPFRSGAIRMARDAGVPIIPCVTWGSHRLVTYGHEFSVRRAWRIPVTVRYGEPFRVGPEEDVQAATDRLRQVMVALLHEVQEQYPGGNPQGVWWVPARLGGGAPPPEPDHREPVTESAPDTDPPFAPLESTSGRAGTDVAATDEGPPDRADDGGETPGAVG